MNNKLTYTIKYIVIILAIIGLATPAFAAGIKDRMKARLPVIKTLKSQGAVGENNKGYLEIKKPSADKKVVAEENADRLTVYSKIAKMQGVTPEFVGKRRAAQISENADPGHLIQGPDGKWHKK